MRGSCCSAPRKQNACGCRPTPRPQGRGGNNFRAGWMIPRLFISPPPALFHKNPARIACCRLGFIWIFFFPTVAGRHQKKEREKAKKKKRAALHGFYFLSGKTKNGGSDGKNLSRGAIGGRGLCLEIRIQSEEKLRQGKIPAFFRHRRAFHSF